MMRLPLRLSALLVMIFMITSCANQHHNYTEHRRQQSELATRAAALLHQQDRQPHHNRIPRKLIKQARCIAVFPKIARAGAIVGGQGGSGLISCRDESGSLEDSAPGVFTVSSGSIGLQLGASTRALILLFMTPESMDMIDNMTFRFGSQVGVVAGPKGHDRTVDIDKNHPVVAYAVANRGLYAGINLSGSKLSFARDANMAVYGPDPRPHDILRERRGAPSTMRNFSRALAEFAAHEQDE